MPRPTSHLTIKLQIRISPDINTRIQTAKRLWSPKGTTYTDSDIVRMVLEDRLPRIVETRRAIPS